MMQILTAQILTKAGWYNSWIDGVRRWHHKTLPTYPGSHFKTLNEAKAIHCSCSPNQTPPATSVPASKGGVECLRTR